MLTTEQVNQLIAAFQEAKQMTKRKQKVAELFETLDANFDAKAFAELERTAPDIAESIRSLVGQGVEPRAIKTHLMRKYPNRWLEAQVVEQAARWVEAEG